MILAICHYIYKKHARLCLSGMPRSWVSMVLESVCSGVSLGIYWFIDIGTFMLLALINLCFFQSNLNLSYTV